MNKQTMTEAILPTVAQLRDFTKQVNDLASLLERTCKGDTDGTNLSSMAAIREVLDHPWFAVSKARPVLNGAYKALFENARANAVAAAASACAHLDAFAPPKRGRKKKEQGVGEPATEAPIVEAPATEPDTEG